MDWMWEVRGREESRVLFCTAMWMVMPYTEGGCTRGGGCSDFDFDGVDLDILMKHTNGAGETYKWSCAGESWILEAGALGNA